MTESTPNDPWATSPLDPSSAQSGPSTSGSPRKKKIAAGVVAAVLLVGGAGGIYFATESGASTNAASTTGKFGSAPNADGGRAGLGSVATGTITGIDGNTLALTASNGTKSTVTVTNDTSYIKTAAGTVSDIKTGDHVSVRGDEKDDTVTASAITDSGTSDMAQGGGMGAGFGNGAPPNGQAPSGTAGADGQSSQRGTNGGQRNPTMGGTNGTVSKITGDTMVVTTENGDVTVTISAQTKISVVSSIGLSDLKVGETISVSGEAGTNESITARLVRTGELETFSTRSRPRSTNA